MKLGLLIPLFWFSISCQPSDQQRSNEFRTENMTQSSTDVMVPVSLWQILESHYAPLQAFGNAQIKSKKEFTKSRIDIPMKFMAVNVYLVEKTRNLLEGDNRKLVFGDGGGVIDLKDYIGDRSGLFEFSVELIYEGKVQPSPTVYFLSNSKKRMIGSVSFGSGCNVYLEITDYFNKVMKDGGLQLTTLDSRHLSVLAGTFFFVTYLDGNLVLAQLTVKDSGKVDLQCHG